MLLENRCVRVTPIGIIVSTVTLPERLVDAGPVEATSMIMTETSGGLGGIACDHFQPLHTNQHLARVLQTVRALRVSNVHNYRLRVSDLDPLDYFMRYKRNKPDKRCTTATFATTDLSKGVYGVSFFLEAPVLKLV